MRIETLVLREIMFRRKSVFAGIVAVALATGVFVGTLNLLDTYKTGTRATLAGMKAELDTRVTELNDDIRAAMDGLGFTSVIIPAGQNLGDYYAEDYAAELMPEEYLDKLIRAELHTVSYLQPRLRWRIKWPETKWTVILVGSAENIATMNEAVGPPAYVSIPSGSVELGYEVHHALGYSTGQNVRIMGTDFVVRSCTAERGTKDDISIWFNLGDAQALLGKTGMINEILALPKESSWTNFSLVRTEIGAVLPDTRVIAYTEKMTALTAARSQTVSRSNTAIAVEAEAAAERYRAMMVFGLVLVPVVFAVCLLWLVFQMLDSIRIRKNEIGVLYALGFCLPRIMLLFMLRAVVTGCVGGILGFVCSLATGPFSGVLFGVAMVTACGITALATIVPLAYTAMTDPAEILN
jgi:putative ABC transport system permease protein